MRHAELHALKNSANWKKLRVLRSLVTVGAGGGYVFGSSVRAAVRACVRASVRPSVIHVVVLCFRDISSIC